MCDGFGYRSSSSLEQEGEDTSNWMKDVRLVNLQELVWDNNHAIIADVNTLGDKRSTEEADLKTITKLNEMESRTVKSSVKVTRKPVVKRNLVGL